MKRYGRSMLSEDQAKWIVNDKLEKNLLTGKLQAYKGYQLEGYSSFTTNAKGALCVQKKAGRHKQPLPEQVKYEIIKLYKMYRANASYIDKILRTK
ncbi:MAG: hypothetical protein RXR51_05985 [Nitrososphaeria archaeon]